MKVVRVHAWNQPPVIEEAAAPVRAATSAAAPLPPGGHAVRVGSTAGPELPLDLPHFLQRDASLLPLNMIRREASGRARAPELLARLADGRLQLAVQEFPLADAARALEWIAERGRKSRAVLVPDRPAV